MNESTRKELTEKKKKVGNFQLNFRQEYTSAPFDSSTAVKRNSFVKESVCEELTTKHEMRFTGE